VCSYSTLLRVNDNFMSCCTELNNIYDGMTVKDSPELNSKLEEVSTDYKNWVTTFRCTICGQAWIERYNGKGHGEVPEVYKQNE
jgi:hypothetical protein